MELESINSLALGSLSLPLMGTWPLKPHVPGQGLWLAAACRVGRGLEAVPRREGLLTVSIRRNVERSVCQIVARTPLIETH